MNIPYGLADFGRLRREAFFYADKTRFIPLLESQELGNSYLVFLRPRRMGKSLLISMLEHYYDLARADHFDELFSGLYIHAHPTPRHNRYLVLTLDFSGVIVSDNVENFSRSLTEQVRARALSLLYRVQGRFPSLDRLMGELSGIHDSTGILAALDTAAEAAGVPMYVLIDEYDSISNVILSQGATGLYETLVSGRGPLNAFFRRLKEAARNGSVERIFLTGVTPVTLDDLASAFNITTSLSQSPLFHEMAGLTRAEVEQAVEAFLARTPELGTRAGLLTTFEQYYDGYRFSRRCSGRLYNPEMVFYYLQQLRSEGGPPLKVLDDNVRTDYTKLRRIATPEGGVQDWHLDFIAQLLSNGSVSGDLIDRFGMRELYDRQHLVSLLFYMGLLTIKDFDGVSLTFTIPNIVMRLVHWEELSWLFRQRGEAKVDTSELQEAVGALAMKGDPGPVVDLLREKVLKVLSNRDLIAFDEKAVKLILLTYLSMSPVYRILSETEMAQGYSDVFLALDNRFQGAKYTWMIELKYLKANASAEEVEAKRLEAVEQLEKYLSDKTVLPAVKGDRSLRAMSLVVVGGSQTHWRIEREVS